MEAIECGADYEVAGKHPSFNVSCSTGAFFSLEARAELVPVSDVAADDYADPAAG